MQIVGRNGPAAKIACGWCCTKRSVSWKKLRLTLTVTDEEEPAFDRRWIAVPGGWKRCRGKSFEDLVGVCGRNILEFKPITMPDGRTCDVYPTCN